MIYFCDIEANGLLEEATKIHCLSYKAYDVREGMGSHTFVSEFELFFTTLDEDTTLVWHNGFGYDLPLLVKLGIIKGYTPTTVTLMDGTVKNIQLIDSLALSREWWPDNPKGHGLEAWAKKLGTYKPFIEDWENLSVEEYIDRCTHDVITTEKLFVFLADKLGVEL